MPTDPKTQQPTPPDGEATPQYVSKEEFAKLQEQANQQSAILRKEREAAAKLQKELTERFEALASRIEQAPAAEPSKSGKTDAEKAAEVAQAKYEARIKELEAKTAASEAKAAETEARQRAAEERSALAAGLAELGVDGPKQRMAIALLYGEDKKIGRDDAGNVVFRVKRGTGPNAFDDLVSLEEGLKEWAGTEEGKSVLPPRGVAGSGTQPGGPPRRGDGKMSQADAARALQYLILKGD